MKWSPSALSDVQRLYRFLATNDKDAARQAVSAIRRGVQVLAQQPEAGRPAEEMDPEFREWLIDFGSSGYLALYHLDGNDAVILAARRQKESGY